MSYLSDFEHTKLDARVFPGFVIQTHYVSDPITGQRRVPKEKVWKVERLLGKGGFGEVRLEVHPEENEKRAVKRMWATGSSFKKEYERELKALLEFSKPKYKESAVFVEFLGWFEDAECVYLAMEYVPLGDLEENVQAIGGVVKEAEVRDITIQILEGLRIMHLENFAHRDLKPKNVLVCKGPPHWWIKLADFGVSKHRTEETAYRTQTGTQAYMAPEILNYVPGVNPKSSEYTNAVDIWALGCMVYRLVNGVVPFPPGPSLLNFCGDESKFPSQGSALSEPGANFVRDLVVPYPSRRITAQQALDHAWTKFCPGGFEAEDPPVQSDFKGSESSTAHPITQSKRNGLDSVASFGGYNTVTHAGLQSYGPAASTQRLNPVHAESGPPKPSYHPPTVEDEEIEAAGARGLEENIILDQRQGQSSSDPAPPAKADTHGMSNEVEEPEITIKRSHRKSDNFRSTSPEVVTTVRRKPAKRADPEPVSPELSDSSSDPSWEIYLNGSNIPRPQSRQAPEPTRYIVDSDRSVPITARHHSDVGGGEKAANTRRSESPKSPPARKPTRYIIDNGRSVPVTSRHRAELRDSNEASYTRDRSVSPPIQPTRYSRRQYFKPLSYEEEWGDPPNPLTPNNLNKLAAEYEPSDSADGSVDAISCPMSETGAVRDFRPTASTSSENSFPPIPSSDPVVNVTSAERRVYFADERGYVDHVPERAANRRGNILAAPEPPTPASKEKNKPVYNRSSPKFKPKMTMEDKDGKRVLEWQEDVARNLADLEAEIAEWRGERTSSERPKMPPRDGGSSRKGTDINGQPVFGEVKYARNYGADQVIYGSNPDRNRGDSDSNHEQGPAPLYGREQGPEPIIYSARPKKPSRERSSRSGSGRTAKPLYGPAKDARYIGAEPIIYGPNPAPYRRDNNLNHQQGSTPNYSTEQEPDSEPIIHTARPKIPSRGGSSRRAASSRYQPPPVYGEVKYARQYSAENVIYAPAPDAPKRDEGGRGSYTRSHPGEENPPVYA